MEKMVNAEFFDALEQLEKEKGIPVDYMLDRVGQALITAYKRDNDGMTDNVYVEPDRDKKTIHMFVRKTVVKAEDLYEPYEEITLEEAAEYKNNPMVGDIIDIDIPTKSFGRIAAQTAKQVIIQGIREAERGMVISEFESKEHEILNGVVARIDPRSGTAYLDVVSGGEKSEGLLLGGFRAGGAGEVLDRGSAPEFISLRSAAAPAARRSLFPAPTRVWLSVCLSWRCRRSTPVSSRSSPSRVRQATAPRSLLFPTMRTWIRSRMRWYPRCACCNITGELNGEKIDIIKWNEDMAQFVSAALAPADVINATMQQTTSPAVSSFRTISCPSLSARKARTRVWLPS